MVFQSKFLMHKSLVRLSTVSEEILRREGYPSAAECREIHGRDCGVGAETGIFEPRAFEVLSSVVYYSLRDCHHLRKLLGFVCGLGSAQPPFQEYMAARQDHHEK